MRFLALLACAALSALLPACNNLPEIQGSGCGNRLLNAESEDCDGPSSSGTCGEPGQPGACRFLCDLKGQVPRGGCPESFACGVDGICRQPTGGFAQVGASVQVTARELHTGDTDGDGRVDLLALSQSSSSGASQGRLLSFGDRGALSAMTLLQGELRQPVILPLTAPTATSALVSNASAGLATTLGQSGRTFVPKNYPSIPLGAEVKAISGLAMDAMPSSSNYAGDEILVFASVEMNGGVLNVFGHSDGTKIEPLLALAESPESLLAQPRAGRLLWPKSDEHYCPSVVFAFKNAKALRLFTPCIGDGAEVRWVQQGENGMTDLAIGNGGELVGPPHLVDINRDGFLDVVVTVNEMEGAWLHAAYGTGQGYLVPAPGSEIKNQTARLSLPVAAPYSFGDVGADAAQFFTYPLALGHFDGDDVLDVVTSYNIFTSGVGKVTSASYAPTFQGYLGESWTEVRICDLNGDGHPDLVNARESAVLDVLLGTGNGSFSNSSLPLNGVSGGFSVGDFDGDLLDDVAFRERAYDTDGDTNDTLSVLFGARQGIPSEIVRMGQFGEILTTSSGSIFNPFSEDLASDIGIFSRSNGQMVASQFFGSSDRRLRSFLVLQSIQINNGNPVIDIDAPLNMIGARFAAGATPGLVVLGASRDFLNVTPSLGEQPSSAEPRPPRLWRLEPEGDANFSSLRAMELPGVQTSQGVLAAGDLDADGIDEIVLLSDTGGPPVGETPGAAPSTPSTQSFVFKVESAGAPAAPFVLSNSGSLRFPITADSSAQIADIDGDGLPELIVLNRRLDYVAIDTGTASSPDTSAPGDPTIPAEEISTGSLWIVPQSAPGTLDWNSMRRLDAQEFQRKVTGFCLLESGANLPRLVVSAETGVFLGTLQGGSFSFSPLQGNSADPIYEGEAVACADFDGDGVRDIALSSGDTVRLLRGVPRLP